MCFCREVLLGEFGDSKRIANNSSAWGFCNCVWMWRADVIPAEQKAAAAAAAWGCLTCHLAQREIGWPGSSFFILFFYKVKLFNSVCLNWGGTKFCAAINGFDSSCDWFIEALLAIAATLNGELTFQSDYFMTPCVGTYQWMRLK